MIQYSSFWILSWISLASYSWAWISISPPSITTRTTTATTQTSVYSPLLQFDSPQSLTDFSLSMSSSSSSNDETKNSSSEIRIMVNGMPGPMATAAAEACLRKGLKLAPVGLTGPEMSSMTISVYDPDTQRSSDVKLIPANDEGMLEMESVLEGLRANKDFLILVIDYTHPSAVNQNGKWYAKHQLPFVMGTTGGDRELLIEDVNAQNCPAVIAPNMGKQIVAMQAALEDLAKNFPNAFVGYSLEVVESHQSTKADTSGTAKAVIQSLNGLSGGDFDVEEDIQMLRTKEESLDFGVSEEALDGHAFHTYTLTSSDGSVQFALQHNVEGRRVYAEGTADAVKFLAKKVQMDGEEPRIFSMIDVLKEGALE